MALAAFSTRRRRSVAAVVAVGTAAVAGWWLVGAPGTRHPTTTSTTTNTTTLMRPATLYVSTTGSDTGICSTIQTACASIGYAVGQAACGDVILVADGSYPLQTVGYQTYQGSCRNGSRVTIEPAPGATPSLGGLQLGHSSTSAGQWIQGPAHIDLKGAFRFTTATQQGMVEIGPQATDVIVDGITTKGTTLQVSGVRGGILVEHSTLGYASASASLPTAPVEVYNGNEGTTGFISDGVTFRENTIHDFTTSNGGLYHIECMFIKYGSHITIDRNRFYHCQVFDLFVQTFPADGGVGIQHLTLTNNLFGEAWNDTGFATPTGTNVVLDSRSNTPIRNVTYAFNSNSPGPLGTGATAGKNLGGAFQVSTNPGYTYSHIQVTGNTIVGGCATVDTPPPNTTFRYNRLVAFSQYTNTKPCGPTDTIVAWDTTNPFGYTTDTDQPTGHWRLAAGSPAIAVVPPGTCRAITTADYAGKTRPHSGHSKRCNAGAYENR